GVRSIYSEEATNHHVTAFLNTETARNSKADIANGQNGALQNYCVNHARLQIERVERDPNFSRVQDQGKNCPSAASDESSGSGVKGTDSLIERFAALNERLPLRRIRQLPNHSR